MFFCLASFIFFPVLYCCRLHLKKSTADETHQEGLEDDERIETYGALLVNLDLENIRKNVLIATPMLNMLLRLSLTVIASFLSKPDLQVFLIMLFQLAHTVYIIVQKPFQDNNHYTRELIKDFNTLVFIYAMLLMTDFILRKET